MALTSEQVAKCRAWATAPARHWQILNRAKWKYQFRGSVIVRYVEEVKMDEEMVRDMLVYLTSDDCLQDLETYNQELTPAGEYKPTKAWYEMGGKTAGGVRSVRLYHAMTSDPEENADGPYLVEDGCVSKVSLEYHWNEPSVPDVQPSTSGISYRINGITHDPDTDLYSYVIERRERVQQDVAEYFTAKTVYSEQSEEYHLGVRQNQVESTGRAASVGNGKIVRRKISKNADCTSDVHNTIEQEIAVPESSVQKIVSLTGDTIITKNTNMVSPASDSDLEIGGSVENVKTEGGRWTQIIRRVVRNVNRWIAGACSKTIFSHHHTERRIQGTNPGFTHVVEAGGGKVIEKRVNVTSDGSYEVSDSTTTELPVLSASVRVHKTLRGVVKSTTNRNQSSPLATEGLGIGESVENSKTEGGLYNTTKTEATHESVGRISVSEEEDRHSKQRAELSNVATDPGEPEVTFATGMVKQKAVRITENGTWDVNESLVTAKPSRVIKRWSDSYHDHLVCHYRNQPEPLVPDEFGTYTSTNVNFSLNQFNLYDGSYTIAVRNSFDGSGKGKNRREKSTKTVKVRQYFTPGASWGRNAKKVRWYRWIEVKYEVHSACGPSAIADAYTEVSNATTLVNTDDGTLPNSCEKYESKVLATDFGTGSATWRILKSAFIQKAWNMETVQ